MLEFSNISCFHNRTMSSLRATPPLLHPLEEDDTILQDSPAWTSDKQDRWKKTPSPLSHDQHHEEELQPNREQQIDEWEEPAAMVS